MNHLNQTATAIAKKLYELMEPNDSIKISNTEGFMPVHLEKRTSIPKSGKVFSIAHYYEQQGDLMSDPYMEFLLSDKGFIHPILFEQHGSLQTRQEVIAYNEDGTIKGYRAKMQNDLIAFANQWLMNIKRQQKITIQRPEVKITLLNINEKENKALIKLKGKFSTVEIQEDQDGQHYILVLEKAIYLKDLNK